MMAEHNFCKNCYSKYLVLFHGEIEHHLSEPISDWRQTENNIDWLWIKAKGFYSITNSTIFSPQDNAFKKAANESVFDKLNYLRNKERIKNYTYEFLNKVRKRRNKIHPPSKFSKQDYILFREARAITDAMFIPIIHDLKSDIWKNTLANVEKRAKLLLEYFKLS